MSLFTGRRPIIVKIRHLVREPILARLVIVRFRKEVLTSLAHLLAMCALMPKVTAKRVLTSLHLQRGEKEMGLVTGACIV
jgi:hypothetical protein